LPTLKFEQIRFEAQTSWQEDEARENRENRRRDLLPIAPVRRRTHRRGIGRVVALLRNLDALHIFAACRIIPLAARRACLPAIKKRKQNSQAKPAYSKIQIRKEVNHAAKTIQGLTFVNDRTKKLGLKRLARLSRSLPANLRGAAVKK
jgi:hypothetical protein